MRPAQLMRMEKRGKQRECPGASVTHASGKIQLTVERALFPVLEFGIESRVSFREVNRAFHARGVLDIPNNFFLFFFGFYFFSEKE